MMATMLIFYEMKRLQNNAAGWTQEYKRDVHRVMDKRVKKITKIFIVVISGFWDYGWFYFILCTFFSFYDAHALLWCQ